jgi:hypothetical protein
MTRKFEYRTGAGLLRLVRTVDDDAAGGDDGTTAGGGDEASDSAASLRGAFRALDRSSMTMPNA